MRHIELLYVIYNEGRNITYEKREKNKCAEKYSSAVSQYRRVSGVSHPAMPLVRPFPNQIRRSTTEYCLLMEERSFYETQKQKNLAFLVAILELRSIKQIEIQ